MAVSPSWGESVLGSRFWTTDQIVHRAKIYVLLKSAWNIWTVEATLLCTGDPKTGKFLTNDPKGANVTGPTLGYASWTETAAYSWLDSAKTTVYDYRAGHFDVKYIGNSKYIDRTKGFNFRDFFFNN